MKKKKPSPSEATANHRDWSSLPDLTLTNILDRLLFLPILFAFAAVCRSWRSLSRFPTPNNSSRPPLLLHPILNGRCRNNHRWAYPPRCRLDSPIPGSPSHSSPIPSPALAQSCIGCSFGQLILLRRRRGNLIIVDVFTSHEIRPPALGFSVRQSFTRGFLTAPPSSPECHLILEIHEDILYSWRLGDVQWAEHRLGFRVLGPIQQVVNFKGRVLALDFRGSLFTLRFSPQLSHLDLWEGLALLRISDFIEQLVECGGELVRIQFFHLDELDHVTVKVYRLDLSRDVPSWVRMESLGDWCLFTNVRGVSAMACHEPARWGGRSNSIYITGPGVDNWMEIPFDGSPVDCVSSQSPFNATNRTMSDWPSPLWVYPSMIL